MSAAVKDPELVRSTCAAFQTSMVEIDSAALEAFANSINLVEVHQFCESGDGLSTNRFDSEVCFPTLMHEAGFILFAHGLDFGSGFRYILHEARNGQGAWLTIRAGLVKLGQADPTLSASWLQSLTVEDIIGYFDLAASDGLIPLALQLLASIHEFGENISKKGFSCPGEYLASVLQYSDVASESNGSFAPTTACSLVAELVETFPITFQDEYVVRDQRVCLYKKDQLVVSELFMRFYKVCRFFNFADIDRLTAFVDNVVVAMMRMTGVIKCTEAIDADIAAGRYIERASEEEVAMRSKALTAVELLVARCNQLKADSVESINSQRLCNWLWGCLGKKPENRSYPRHLAPSTSFY